MLGYLKEQLNVHTVSWVRSGENIEQDLKKIVSDKCSIYMTVNKEEERQEEEHRSIGRNKVKQGHGRLLDECLMELIKYTEEWQLRKED